MYYIYHEYHRQKLKFKFIRTFEFASDCVLKYPLHHYSPVSGSFPRLFSALDAKLHGTRDENQTQENQRRSMDYFISIF